MIQQREPQSSDKTTREDGNTISCVHGNEDGDCSLCKLERVPTISYLPPQPDDPGTMEEWRAFHADLLKEEDLAFEWGGGRRKDEPNFSEMDSMGLGSDEKKAMGQVQIARDGGTLRRVPVWMNNDTAVKQLLVINFPNLGHDLAQRQIAAKWFFFIQHFRTNVSAAQIAREWNAQPHEADPDTAALEALFGEKLSSAPTLDAAQVRSTMQKIINVASGLTQNGKKSKGKRGRPKKVTQTQVA